MKTNAEAGKNSPTGDEIDDKRERERWYVGCKRAKFEAKEINLKEGKNSMMEYSREECGTEEDFKDRELFQHFTRKRYLKRMKSL